ncbi:MAG: peptide MFS transporter [Bacteroidales bacterium]|nr:peptide MFS transporter [Bacteroidales bacterium]MCD8393717.1 peptide MFS transporter [Bacteroidales bacterium]
MFKNQPKGLYVLALANTGERFGYYTMLAILLLFLQAKFAFSTATAGFIYSTFLALVYFMPMIGGWIADKWNFQKTVTLGIIVMFLGYLVMSYQGERGATSTLIIVFAGLILIACGTGLFKGNLQVMVGDLYNDPRYSDKRDVAFSLFYMAINIGAMFAPSVTEGLLNLSLRDAGLVYNPAIPSICNKLLAGEALKPEALATITEFTRGLSGDALMTYAGQYIDAISKGYSYAFAVACGSMVLSFLIYKLGRSTYKQLNETDKSTGKAKAAGSDHELTPAQTKSRIVALLLVFTVVIFFWMVFHQNGATLTKFAEVFTSTTNGSWTRIGFNVWALATIVVLVYSVFNLFSTRKLGAIIINAVIAISACVGIGLFYIYLPQEATNIQPQIYQQFNPFYVVALTPFSVAIFAWLAKKKKEPSAPRKIGYGMLVAAFAFGLLLIGSLGLGVAPTEGQADHLVSPNWLITTYLFLTFAELLLSPMGISFVSKVAPPKYKGLMMGCWFGATAIGNYLVVIPTLLWNHINVAVLWGILIVVCLISATFIFSIMKKLEAATSDTPAPVAPDALETVEDDAI